MGKLKKVIWYLEVVFKLGIRDVLYVSWYRLSLKKGWHKKKFPVETIVYRGDFFSPVAVRNDFPEELRSSMLKEADALLEGKVIYYSYHSLQVGNPPNWFVNPFNAVVFRDHQHHWTELPDFGNAVGDIKNIWEASRFSWATVLARAYAVSGEEKYLQTLNHWIKDWTEKNPLNIGPNWKCGQESSLRLLNVLMCAVILQQEGKPSESLIRFTEAHIKRIEPNIRYAIAQRNNHATSELSALLIAFSWLDKLTGKYKRKAEHYRKHLEKIVAELVYPDGSFAQHSVTYHRLFLDSMSLVMWWSRKFGTASFSDSFIQKITASANWLLAMIDQESGDCPNLGANDGALLMNYHSLDYRNFKASLQLSKALYQQQSFFDEAAINEPLYWLSVDKATLREVGFSKSTQLFQNGYCIMENDTSWAMVRFPFYSFRPAHNDVMHFDLWSNGKNLLMDSGSYSYNPGKDYKGADLKSVHAHNTVSFDGKEQMPRLSRFLLAKWIKPSFVSRITTANEMQEWSAAYTDYRGNHHLRKVQWQTNEWIITDDLKSAAASATINFNFDDDTAYIDEEKSVVYFKWGELHYPPGAKANINEHIISKYYWQQQAAQKLTITTTGNFVSVVRIILR